MRSILGMSNNWHLMLSKNRQVDSIFFDVRKAFDSVPHDKLISLACTGISGPLLQCFLDYVSHNRQRVVLDSESSNLVAAPSGVPQGPPPIYYYFFYELNL